MDIINSLPQAGVTLQQSVAQFLAAHPESIAFFLKRRMLCPGCSMATFDTLADVARNYSIPPDRFQNELVYWLEANNKGAQ